METNKGIENAKNIEMVHDAPDGQFLGKNGKLNGQENNRTASSSDPTEGAMNKIHVRKPSFRYYKMNHKRRGIALIFNHQFFDIPYTDPRPGTDVDCKNLKERLFELGFAVHEFVDLNFADIQSHILRTAEMDHTDHDCILIAVLSHGGIGNIYAKDCFYKPDDLWDPFTDERCPTLAGKPKIFLLQACRGNKFDDGVTLSKIETDGEIYDNYYRVLVQPDFLIVYSTAGGYFAWRNSTKGSWFIQSLCKELTKQAYNVDLVTLLTFVSQRVALDFESYKPTDSKQHQKKQVPCIMNMLTKLIQFQPPTA